MHKSQSFVGLFFLLSTLTFNPFHLHATNFLTKNQKAFTQYGDSYESKGAPSSLRQDQMNKPSRFQEFKNRKAYFNKAEKRRKAYHLLNIEHHGQRYTKAVAIAKIAAQLMEKPFDEKKSFEKGLRCLSELHAHRQDVYKIHQIQTLCNGFLSQYKDLFKQSQKRYHKRSPFLQRKLDKERTALLKEKFPEQEELVEYLQQSFKPYMSCSLHGASLIGAYLIGASIGGHYLICESKLGRRKLYGTYKAQLGFGFGAYLTKTSQKYRKKGEDYYNTKRFLISYQDFENSKKGFTNSIGGALGIAVESHSDVGKKQLEYGLGFGSFAGSGFGQVFHIKHLSHNFEHLFELLDMGFHTVDDEDET